MSNSTSGWDWVILEDVQRAQVKRLYSLLTMKDSASTIPRNLEARRRLEFFTNSLFMDMPVAKPVRQMLSFRLRLLFINLFYSWMHWYFCLTNLTPWSLCMCICSVFTPYYSETVLYSMSELQKKNEDGISILFYLQKIYPGTSFFILLI